MFSGSSFPLGLVRILCDWTNSGKFQDGGLLTSIACISATRQDINEISTATPMFLRFSISSRLGRILCYQTRRGKAKIVTSEFQIRICRPTVLLVDQNFSYHIGVIARKQVQQSRMCGQLCAGPQKRRYNRWSYNNIESTCNGEHSTTYCAWNKPLEHCVKTSKFKLENTNLLHWNVAV